MNPREQDWRESMTARDRDYIERGLVMHFIGGPLHGRWSIGSDSSLPTLKYFPDSSNLAGSEYYEPWHVPTFYVWKGSQA